MTATDEKVATLEQEALDRVLTKSNLAEFKRMIVAKTMTATDMAETRWTAVLETLFNMAVGPYVCPFKPTDDGLCVMLDFRMLGMTGMAMFDTRDKRLTLHT